jgi:hypothetical protein
MALAIAGIALIGSACVAAAAAARTRS